MRYTQVFTAGIFALTTAASFAGKSDPAIEAQAIIGSEYTAQPSSVLIAPNRSSCVAIGEGDIYIKGEKINGWAKGQALCNGRTAITLLKEVENASGHPTLKVVDTLLLPALAKEGSRNRSSMPVLHLDVDGQCDVPDLPKTSYGALIRWNKREHIDWRTGVEKAWTFDIDKQRIVPASTRRIVCDYSDP